MDSKAKYSLQRTMIIYFLLIGFASLLVGIEFIVDTNKKDLRDALFANFEKYSKGDIDSAELFSPIDKLRNKAILMIGIILFVMIIVLTMFIKNITEPLQHMIESAKEISAGDLSQTLKIHADNELSELGNVINEMSSNLQEIILLSRNMCSSGFNFVDNATAILDKPEINPEDIGQVNEEIQNLKNELEMLSEVIDVFSFYTLESEA